MVQLSIMTKWPLRLSNVQVKIFQKQTVPRELNKESMDSCHCSESVKHHQVRKVVPLESAVAHVCKFNSLCVLGGGGWMLLYVHRNCRLITIRDRNAGRPSRLSHSSWAPCVSVCARVSDILWMSPKTARERPCSRKVCSTGKGGGVLGWYNSVPVPVSTTTDQPWVTRVVILISH